MKAGVYKIYCKTTGKSYIGASADIQTRLGTHARMLNGGFHQNTELQQDWQAYGCNDFDFSVLEVTPVSNIFQAEARYMHAHDGAMYNLKGSNKPETNNQTKEANKRIQAAAMELVSSVDYHAIDDDTERKTFRQQIYQALQDQTGCAYETARRHVAKALRRHRAPDITPPDAWGGDRRSESN